MVCEVSLQVQQPQQQQKQLEASAPSSLNGSSCNQEIVHFSWAQRGQAKACLETLVKALADDPVNNYFSGSKRVKFCKDEVKGYLKALPDAANFIATADSMAVALWQLLPNETPRNELWAGWTRILKVSPRLWRQLLKLELRYESAHDDVAEQFGSYYYLSFIGSRPEVRGKGYGSLLLSHITQKADAEGRWCMLEATSERSQALYARHGFVTYEAYRVSKKAPPVFLMKRAPVPVSLASAASTPLSAAALRMAAAAHGKFELAATGSPGSDCGRSTCSSLISAVVRGQNVESDSDSASVSDIEEGTESEYSDSEGQQKSAGFGSADAGVIIRSNSSTLNLKEKCVVDAEAAAASPAGAQHSSSTVTERGSIQQSEQPGSNLAGAGGPTRAAAGSA